MHIPVTEGCIVNNDTSHYCLRSFGNVDVHPPTSCGEGNTHLSHADHQDLCRGRREERGTHDNSTSKKDKSSTPPVYEVPWGYGTEDIDDGIDTSHENGIAADPAGLFKNSSCKSNETSVRIAITTKI